MDKPDVTNSKSTPPHADTEMPFLSHLIELRDRLLRIVLVVLVIFMALFPFANTLYEFLAAPLISYLPKDGGMIAVGVISPFLTPLKLVFVCALFLSIPYLLYHLWSFVAPGLYKHERALFKPLLVSSSVLFYVGAAFAYFVVFPLVFGFIAGVVPDGVEMATDIALYLDFVLRMFFAFGLAFEVPIFTVLLVWTGMATPESLADKRPFIVVGAFVVAMLLTPPDMVSQILLAIPMLLLFELGLWMSRYLLRKKAEAEAADAATATENLSRPLMTDEEMDAELDRLSAEDDELGKKS